MLVLKVSDVLPVPVLDRHMFLDSNVSVSEITGFILNVREKQSLSVVFYWGRGGVIPHPPRRSGG